MEAWKSVNTPAYPFRMEENQPNRQDLDRSTRPNTTKLWKDSAKTKAARESMGIDCARLWNNAPSTIKMAANKAAAKMEIKKFCRTLQI